MSHELKRYDPCMELYGSDYYPVMDEDPTGEYYKVDEVDDYIASLQSKIDKLEGKGDLSEEKLHYYAFTYRGDSLSRDSQIVSTTYTGYPTKNLNMKCIEKNKEYAGVTKRAALINLFYMGYMTEAEMKGD